MEKSAERVYEDPYRVGCSGCTVRFHEKELSEHLWADGRYLCHWCQIQARWEYLLESFPELAMEDVGEYGGLNRFEGDLQRQVLDQVDKIAMDILWVYDDHGKVDERAEKALLFLKNLKLLLKSPRQIR